MKTIGPFAMLLCLALLLSSCAPALPDFKPFESEEESQSESLLPTAEIPTLSLDRRRYSFTGKEEAITAEDDLLTIGQAGSYRLTGTLSEGGLSVDVGAFGVVRLILDDVSLASTGRPVLHVRSAAAVILETEEGSVNLFRSTAKTAVMADGNLLLTGSGSLSISGAPVAISSLGRVAVESGSLRITASECGILANTAIEMTGGEVAVNAASFGFKTEERSDSSGGILLRGGSLTAVCSETVLSAKTRILLTGGKGSFDAPRFYLCESNENGVPVKGELRCEGGDFPPVPTSGSLWK